MNERLLIHTVAVLPLVEADDGTGATIKSWPAIRPGQGAVKCRVMPEAGDEAVRGGQLVVRERARCYVPGRPGILQTDRIRWDGRDWAIIAPPYDACGVGHHTAIRMEAIAPDHADPEPSPWVAN